MKNTKSKSHRSQTSARKIAANRANAQRSSGPRTREGKAKSSLNAVKYGFYARAVLMHGEDPQAYETLREQLWSQLRPQNVLEAIYVREIIDTHWRLQRLASVEATVFTRRSISFTGQQFGPGFAFINDDQGHATLSHLTNCETILSRRLHQAIEQLRQFREKGWKNLPARMTDEPSSTNAASEDCAAQAEMGRPLAEELITEQTEAKQEPTAAASLIPSAGSTSSQPIEKSEDSEITEGKNLKPNGNLLPCNHPDSGGLDSMPEGAIPHGAAEGSKGAGPAPHRTEMAQTPLEQPSTPPAVTSAGMKLDGPEPTVTSASQVPRMD